MSKAPRATASELLSALTKCTEFLACDTARSIALGHKLRPPGWQFVALGGIGGRHVDIQRA